MPLIHTPISFLHADRDRARESPKVAIIVLNWNGWLDTIECVESLLRSDHPNLHIVVCDNNSSDNSFERLKEWANGTLEVESANAVASRRWAYRPIAKPLTYVEYDCSTNKTDFGQNDPPLTFIQTGTNRGYAGGNNIGIGYCIGQGNVEYVWILNNDTVVEHETLGRLIRHAESDQKIGIVGSKILQYGTADTIQALGGGSLSQVWGSESQFGRGMKSDASHDEALDLEHVIGASMFVRAAAIRDVGLIEESYFLYREETDWCIQMRLKGWRLSYCPGAIVWHKEGQSVGFKSILHDYYSVRNMLHLMRKFYPDSLPGALAFLVLIAVCPKIVRLQFKRLRYVLKAFYDFFRGIQGTGDMLPDFDALARRLAIETSQKHAGIREKLAAADFRVKETGPPLEGRPQHESETGVRVG